MVKVCVGRQPSLRSHDGGRDGGADAPAPQPGRLQVGHAARLVALHREAAPPHYTAALPPAPSQWSAPMFRLRCRLGRRRHAAPIRIRSLLHVVVLGLVEWVALAAERARAHRRRDTGRECTNTELRQPSHCRVQPGARRRIASTARLTASRIHLHRRDTSHSTCRTPCNSATPRRCGRMRDKQPPRRRSGPLKSLASPKGEDERARLSG